MKSFFNKFNISKVTQYSNFTNLNISKLNYFKDYCHLIKCKPSKESISNIINFKKVYFSISNNINLAISKYFSLNTLTCINNIRLKRLNTCNKVIFSNSKFGILKVCRKNCSNNSDINHLELNKNSIVKNDITLTHATGVTKMVNISSKESTFRYAKASCYVITNKDVIILVNEDKNKKGDVIKTAEIAGIMAAKNTYKLIPLCHFVNLTTCQIKISTLDDRFFIETYVETVNQTGVEMEAIISCTIAAATIYDMCKSADKSILITNIKLDEKFGGKSGHFINRSQII